MTTSAGFVGSVQMPNSPLVPAADHLPRRISLVDQVVNLLRHGLAEGRWAHEIPGEQALSATLQVSRPTLRKALAQLVSEGCLQACGRGRRHRITGQRQSPAPPRGGIVRVLLPYAWKDMGTIIASRIESFCERMGASGYRVEIEARPHLFRRHQPAELRRLDSLPDTAGWVLFYAPEPMQRWFAQNGRPCLVMGRTFDNVRLSRFLIDAEVTARHAAGRFFARGHREMAYLIADFTSLNDRLASRVFVEEAKRLGARARVLTHAPDPDDIRRTLDRVLATAPHPTAFYCGCPEHCLTILCHLLGRGLRVPQDAAIIAGCDDLCLRFAVPRIAHYQVDGRKAGRAAASVMLDVLAHGNTKPHNAELLPEFVPGGTLDACPVNPPAPPTPDSGRWDGGSRDDRPRP